MHSTFSRPARRIAALGLALGMVVVMASPAAAYCVRRGDTYVVCV